MRFISLLAALMLFAPTAFAQSLESIGRTVFSEVERQVIEDYFSTRSRPPGVDPKDLNTSDRAERDDDDVDRRDRNERDDDDDDDDRRDRNERDDDDDDDDRRDRDDRDDDDDDRDDDKKKKNKGKNGKGHDKGNGKGKSMGKGKSGKMPPGLAKRAELPPGLAKRDTLPPGLAKRDLPNDLARNLPNEREGTKRVVVDNDVVLIEEATGIVLDVIRDVLTGKKQ